MAQKIRKPGFSCKDGKKEKKILLNSNRWLKKIPILIRDLRPDRSIPALGKITE